MSLFDQVLSNVVSDVDSGQRPAGTAASGNAGTVPGTALNNAIQEIGGHKVDVAFVNSLYGGGKITSAQRESILTGSDPSTFGLTPYDLYYVTVGRLGYKITSATIGVIGTWSAVQVYTVGQLALYTEAGNTQPSLFQAQGTVPVSTLPTNASYWVRIAGPGTGVSSGSGNIAVYNPALSYSAGQLVSYQPPGSTPAIFVAGAATQPGQLPSAGSPWTPLTLPGPVVLLEADILNPTLAGLDAASGVTGQQTTAGAALVTFQVPADRRYRVSVSNPRPRVPGTNTPIDSAVTVYPQITESSSQQVGGSAVTLVTITPRWLQTGRQPNLAVAAVTADSLSARVKVELL